MLVIAASAFAAGIILSLRSFPSLLSELNWQPILTMALVATPATLALNALEFSLSARLIGQSVPFGRALTVTIVGSAANLLPLPGAALVRLAALKTGGATLRSGLSATALLAILSLGLGLAYSGAWALTLNSSLFPVAVLCAGLLIVAIACLIARELFEHGAAVLGLIVARLALIALDAARTYLAFAAIGFAASFGQSSVITISTVLAAVVAVVPAGLGLREGIAASMAPSLRLDPAATFLATSLSRIVGLAVVIILTLLLVIARKRPSAS